MYSTRRMTQLGIIAIAALALGACAPMTVNSITARGVDMKQLRTYAWAPDDRLETGDPRLDNNPFFLDRLQGDVEKHLAAKGLEKVDNGTAALTLHYHASVNQKLDLNNMETEYTANQQYTNDDSNHGPLVYDEGSLVLDIVDARTQKLVWRGWAEGSIDGVIGRQDRMEEIVDRAVARIFEKFPGGL